MKYILSITTFLLLLLLAGCRATDQQATCPNWPVAYAPLNIFKVRGAALTPLDTSVRSVLSQAQRQIILHDAYQINCCLGADAVRDSTYTSAFFYATVARLNYNPHAPCHVLVYADMEEFAGLYLVLCAPGPRYASLFVAGEEGIGGTEGDMHIEAQGTVGRLLSDSLVQVKTGSQHLAFPHSGQRSYTDTTTEVFRIDYRTATFHRMSRKTQRTMLAKFF